LTENTALKQQSKYIQSLLIVMLLSLFLTVSDLIYSLDSSKLILVDLSSLGFSILQCIYAGIYLTTNEIQACIAFPTFDIPTRLNYIFYLYFVWFSLILSAYLLNIWLSTLIPFVKTKTWRIKQLQITLGTISGLIGLLFGLFFGYLYLHSFSPLSWSSGFLIFSIAGLYSGKITAGIILKCIKPFTVIMKSAKPIISLMLIALAGIFVAFSGFFGQVGIGPNVLMIVIDTLREDALGIAGRNDVSSPEIDRFFQHEIQLTNIRSDASWTAPAFASLFSGLEPFKHGVTEGNIHFKPDITTLAETFQNNHYNTYGLFCNPVLLGTNGYNKGFDVYSNRLFNRDASDTLLAAKSLIPSLKRSERFFLLVQFMDCHNPYTPDMRFYGNIDQSKSQWKYKQPQITYNFKNPSFNADLSRVTLYRADYQASLHDADRAIGQILRSFQATGLLKNTIIVLTSDHGEEFREHGSLDHCASLYEEIVRIPILLKAPHYKQRLKSIPGMLSDIGSTLLDMVHIPGSFGSKTNLLRLNDPHRTILLDSRRLGYQIGGVIVDQFKYLAPFDTRDSQPVFDAYYPRPWKGIEVFDLSNDPQEKYPVNITPDHKYQLHKIWMRMKSDSNRTSWDADMLGADTTTALKELGYLR